MNLNNPEFKVCEKFISINGEGTRAGQLSVFIRFKGCNLDCSYCDTKWANEKDADFVPMSAKDIVEYIVETSVKNVTLTGGEPLLQPGIGELIKSLKKNGLRVEIETNGAVDLAPFCSEETRPGCFTMDYKLPSSGMENKMLKNNFLCLKTNDCVKFVAGAEYDLERALEIINEYDLTNRCNVYISPVFGSIEPAGIVEFMIDNNLNNVNLQIQMHKVIWNPEERGV